MRFPHVMYVKFTVAKKCIHFLSQMYIFHLSFCCQEINVIHVSFLPIKVQPLPDNCHLRTVYDFEVQALVF